MAKAAGPKEYRIDRIAKVKYTASMVKVQPIGKAIHFLPFQEMPNLVRLAR